jgi:hypothetical protein
VRPRLFAGCLGIAAAACFVVAYVNRDLDPEVGVYFDRVEDGWTGYAPVDSPSAFSPFDPWDGYLWLGAGIAFLLVAVVVLAAARSGSRR